VTAPVRIGTSVPARAPVKVTTQPPEAPPIVMLPARPGRVSIAAATWARVAVEEIGAVVAPPRLTVKEPAKLTGGRS